MSDEPDNVIHVSFGRDGARRLSPPSAEADGAEGRSSSDGAGPARIDRKRDPLADLYTIDEVSRLFGYSTGRLRYWDRSNFIRPSAQSGRRRYYTFQDLISIRAAKGLLDQGVPFGRVRRSVEALRTNLPKVARPLSELRVVADGQAVVVRDEVGAFEPATGQGLLDFHVGSLRDDVVRTLRRPRRDKQRQAAYEHYLEGCRLDENESTMDSAEECYRRAIELDPSLSNALTNLGNLRYRRGFADEAESLYRRALAVDSSQPEALYNLGFLAYERAQLDTAVECFRAALSSDPAFADAHFNLAMAYEELGVRKEAESHWGTYLKLDPSGPWADIARRHLDR